MFRADTGEDLDIGNEFGARVLVEPGEFGAGHDSRIHGQAQLAGDRPCGDGVVAGDQDDVALGVHQRLDQWARRRPRGVRQTDIAEQFQFVRGGVHGVRVSVVIVVGVVNPVAARHGQHPQALLGKAVHQRLCVLKLGVRIGEPAALQHHLGSAFEYQHR